MYSSQLMACLLLFFSPLCGVFADDEIQPIEFVAVYDNAPFSFNLPDGTPSGLYVEFWELWSKANNIPIHITIKSFEDALAAVKNKEAVHVGLFVNNDRQQWANFSLPIHQVETGVLYSSGFPNDVRLAAAGGIRVSAQIGSFQANYIEESLPSLKLSYYDGSDVVINQLLSGDIQAIVAEIPYLKARLARRGLEGVFTLSDEVLLSNTVHAVVAKGQPGLVDILDRGIENIPLNDLVSLEKQWLPTLKPFFLDKTVVVTLTLAEKQWLQRFSPFSLGIETSWYPFEFLDDEGSFKGVGADYVSYVTSRLNINLEPQKNYTWSEAFELLKSGDIDVMSGVVRSSEREKYMDFTNPYFAIPTVIVVRKNSFYAESMSDLFGKKVGVVRGYILADSVGSDYPDIEIQSVDSVADGLEKLNSGELDAFMDAVAVVNHELDRKELTNLIISSFTPYKFEISMAVRKGLEPLVPILNKTFAYMDEKEKSAIANNWLSIHVQTGADIKIILLWAVPVMVFFLSIIFLVMRINKRLENEISIRLNSERKRQLLEAQLHKSQKLEALGKLTGGIAHDFNNMLGVILGYSEILKSELNDNDVFLEYVSHIQHAGERGAKLTGKLLSFTHKHAFQADELNIDALLEQQRDMLQKALSNRIELKVECSDQLWPVWLDSGELVDAMLNISINAKHAMRNNDSNARLFISAKNTSLNSKEAKKYDVSHGDYVCVSFIDTGCGMDENIRLMIFDPFFSTKGEQGTGLGLSQVFGFVQRSGGCINVSSLVGEGTCFEIYFPRYYGGQQTEVKQKKVQYVRRGNESILIVDDEKQLRDLASELLGQQGYKIYQAKNASEALAIMEGEEIDLLFSDVIMPDMDGYQLASIVQQKYPTLPIQLCSGFTDERHINVADNDLHESLLYKPYVSNDLFKKIRLLLDKDVLL